MTLIDSIDKVIRFEYRFLEQWDPILVDTVWLNPKTEGYDSWFGQGDAISWHSFDVDTADVDNFCDVGDLHNLVWTDQHNLALCDVAHF